MSPDHHAGTQPKCRVPKGHSDEGDNSWDRGAGLRLLMERLGCTPGWSRTQDPTVDYHRICTAKSMVSKRLQSFGLVLCIAGLLLPIVYGGTHQAEKLYKEGVAAESHKDYDRAVQLFDQALAISPKDPAYLLADRRARNEAALAHLAAARKLRDQQQLDQALMEFQKAFAIDPSVLTVTQEIAVTVAMIKEREKKGPGAQILTPS